MTRSAAVRDARAFGKVAVLMGGDSAEREISLASGAMVLAALREARIDAHAIDKDRHILGALMDGGFDRVFIVLHGRGGEDGTIQGALETIGMPYTGTGVLGSALAMDKARSKRVWQACGVPTPAFRVLGRPRAGHGEGEMAACGDALGYPLMVKPVHEGSSIGSGRADDPRALAQLWEAAAAYDSEVLIEPWIEGPEYTAAILEGEALPLIRLEPSRGFYDYEAKYADGAGTRYHCPSGLDEGTETRLGALALRAFESLAGRGWGRVDFLCDAGGEPLFIDVNTAPGMTAHSRVPMAARAAGIALEELVWRILETSL